MVQVVEQNSDEEAKIVRKKISKNKKNNSKDEIDFTAPRKSLSIQDAEDIIMSRL